ncbi:MAG: hypothetical protein IJW28_03365 [Clostridia bacterium]|nr:hypothetical protein [Clostridia bacterium]
MKDCVIISMALGLIAGALIVTNNKKAQELVDKGKNAVKKQLEKMS